MAATRIRVKVRDGVLEPADKVDLAEGEEVTVTIDLPEPPSGRNRHTLATWDLGVKEPLTRHDIYDDRA